MTPTVWLLILTIGVLILGLAMAYGVMRNRQRTPVERELNEVGARREYRVEDKDQS